MPTFFSRFGFYSSLTCEKTADEQNRLVVGKLGEKLINKGIPHWFGPHLNHCFRQSAFSDDISCNLGHCEEQTGEKFYGRYPVLYSPTELEATKNYIHFLNDCNSASQSGTFAMSDCETEWVNWTLEGVGHTFREFLGQSVGIEDLSGFWVNQIQV